jgi:hypothetical protein
MTSHLRRILSQRGRPLADRRLSSSHSLPPPVAPVQRLLVVLVVVALFWIAPLAVIARATGLLGQGLRFNLVHWEVTRLAEAAATRGADVFAPRTASVADLERYEGLIEAAETLRRDPHSTAPVVQRYGQGRTADELDAEADRLRPAVEARVALAIQDEVKREGLTVSLPLFSGVRFVWPPVLTGLSVPPHILIISPRNRIELEGTTLLRQDLSLAQQERIEADAERRPNTSALVDQLGGLGAYPPIVDQRQSLRDLFQTAAHEWTHDYLAFHPLGVRYAASGDMTLINETVANIVGEELGRVAYARLGLPQQPPAALASRPAVDFDKTMHALRLEVDALLARGEITEAERRMEETAAMLRAAGYNIRRINQAYFAFYGSYGDNPASSNPLGGELLELRRRSPSLAAFVHVVQNITRPDEVPRLLAAERS